MGIFISMIDTTYIYLVENCYNNINKIYIGKTIDIKWDTTKPNGDLRRQMDTTLQREIGLLPVLGFNEALKLTYESYISNRTK
jgi:dTDP-D-glucose 4,6-dehydratase